MVTLVCTGGETPPAALLGSWLRQADRVIAADGGLTALQAQGVRPDLWIGDGDSIPSPAEGSAAGSLVLLDRQKDDSDTEAAVKAALAGPGDLWLAGGGGGRMDHWWANLRLVEAQPRIRRWLTAAEEIWSLGPGERLPLDAGTVSIFPLGPGPWRARSEGLRWALEGVDFSVWHSLSNEAGPGAAVEAVQGRFLVLVPHRSPA